jgi:uncharacterized protein YbaR (Trm112 family)
MKTIGENMSAVAGLLACPACRTSLPVTVAPLACPGCGRSYVTEDGVALFVPGEAWRTAAGDKTSLPYREKFKTDSGAEGYRHLYEGTRAKRLTTRREKGILARLLASQGHCGSLLDIPSGNGRVSAPLAAATDLLVEADTGLGQVMLGRHLADWATPTVWMTASAFEIPLRDNAVDGAVCNRLMHHLPSAEEQERLIAELLRVSRRFVILSFFDNRSVKNILSVISGRKRRRPGLTVDTIARMARAHGARLAASPRLFLIGSGQRYALLVKPPA